jgi:hypothetical protein
MWDRGVGNRGRWIKRRGAIEILEEEFGAIEAE